MDKGSPHAERRRHPRMSLDLPLEYRVMDAPYAHGGLVVNASEVGLLIHSIRNIPIGSRLHIAVLFPQGFELANFEVLAEIIWKDLYWEEDWEGYRYGLKFIKILEDDRRKLIQILSSQFESSEMSPRP